MCDLMLNILKLVYNVCSKTCDQIMDYIYNGKKHPHKEVKYGYIFVKTLMPAR